VLTSASARDSEAAAPCQALGKFNSAAAKLKTSSIGDWQTAGIETFAVNDSVTYYMGAAGVWRSRT
jgi:hypothetical protein